MKYFWVFCLLASLGWAAPPPVPSAGVVERELEKEYEASPLEEGKEIPSIQIDIPEEKLEIPDGGCVEVSRIEIRGADAVCAAEAEGWVEDYAGRKLCLKEIYEISGKIDAEYAKRGYFLARSYPPPQTVEEGVLVLEVIEGCIGRIIVQDEKFYSKRFIESFFTRLKGRALRYDSFLRAMLLLNETNDLQAAAVFSKGKRVGTAVQDCGRPRPGPTPIPGGGAASAVIGFPAPGFYSSQFNLASDYYFFLYFYDHRYFRPIPGWVIYSRTPL